jgi:hypothetical protein
VTVSITVTEAVRPPLVPVILIGHLPTDLVLVPTENTVEVAVVRGLNVGRPRGGLPVWLIVTKPVKPLWSVTVIMNEPVDQRLTVTADGDAERVNVGVGTIALGLELAEVLPALLTAVTATRSELPTSADCTT